MTNTIKHADKLRFIPPVAALGTAFVLQVVVITDTVGTAMASRYPAAGVWPYVAAALLGVAVASCAEGGAAYLMDLYDKHLLARDSVWLLRIAMIAYVAASGLAIHWWTEQRGLPTIISWLLSGMSASALFLWARGARWRNRKQMVEAGQLDPALPRLPMSAKLLHPARWAVTLFLISWNPVATTDQARARYDEWRDRRTGRTARTELYVRAMVADAEQRAAATLDDALRIADLIGQAAREELSAYWQAATEQAMNMQAEADRQAALTLSAAQQQADSIVVSAEQRAEQLRLTAEARTGDARATTDAEVKRLRAQMQMEADAQRAALARELDALRAQARNEADALLAESSKELADARKLSAEAVRLKADADAAVQRAEHAADSARTPAKAVRPARTGQTATARADVSVEQLADTLGEHFPDRVPGRPSALAVLKQVYGSCSGDRARAAIDVLSARRNGHREQTPDSERLPLTVRINGNRPQLADVSA
jgi:hypothetical protein